jgi:chromosome segregation ATPase
MNRSEGKEDLANFSVTVDRDIHDLAVKAAEERGVSYRHLALNALEKYYGLPESEFKGIRAYKANNKKTQVIKQPDHRVAGKISALNKQVAELENKLEYQRSEKTRYEKMVKDLTTEIEKQDRTLASQAKDIQYWSSQSRSCEAEINNMKCQKFHLQGSIEALNMMINKLLNSRGSEH